MQPLKRAASARALPFRFVRFDASLQSGLVRHVGSQPPPVATPTTTPHKTKNCHSADICVDNPTAPAINASAPNTTRAGPIGPSPTRQTVLSASAITHV
jgi:hypothetical protein